jgi:hypothetical protein
LAGTINERMTVSIEGDFVVFLIGMRVNRWWKLWQWIPVALAMQRMIRETSASPEIGFLGVESWIGNPTIMVQYWRSFELLEAYATDRQRKHLPAWAAFNRAVRSNGDVGIWHETYRVPAGAYEAVYNNMPAFGLGKVGSPIPATGKRQTATGRLGLSDGSDAAVDVAGGIAPSK